MDFPPEMFEPCEFCHMVFPFGGCCRAATDALDRLDVGLPLCPDEDCVSNFHLRGKSWADGAKLKCDPTTHKGRRVFTEAEMASRQSVG